MRIIYSVILSLTTFISWSQSDSIVLLNGKVYTGTITDASAQFRNLKFSFVEKSGETGSDELSYDRLFSYVKEGKETIIYTPNEFTGDFLSIEEARNATLGSYDARQTFKPRVVFYSSIALGLGISLLDTYYSQKAYNDFVKVNMTPPTTATVGFFGVKPTLLPIVVPLILSATWGIPSFRIKEHQILQKKLYGNVDYYRGFHRVAKQKRIFAALTGSAIGIGTGMISYFIFTPN